MRIAHIATVDATLRHVLLPQLQVVLEEGGEAVGISAPGPYSAELEEAGIQYLPLPSSTRRMNLMKDLKAARELWRILRRERFDVLHTHNPKPGFYGRIAGRLAGVPIVVNTICLYTSDNNRLLRRLIVFGLEAIASRFSDVELVKTPEDFALLTRWHITRRSRTRILGNGVDVVRFDGTRFSREDRRRLRRQLGIEEHRIVVGIVGRLVAEKGYPELFEAASLLGDRYTILAIGPDDPAKRDALPPSVLRQAIDQGVRFLGMRTTDLEELYAAMDIFVLPTRRECIPRSVMEAGSMGLPVVTTDIRGVREVVDDGVTGFLVPPGDARALEEAIRKLGEDPALRESMGQAGRRRAWREFDQRQLVRVLMDTYRRVAERKGFSLGQPSGEPPTAALEPRAAGTDPGALD
jgi:glycosyltransferase involved in cell wall biosynthesis